MANKFTIGLVQMKCTANAEENLTKAAGKIREAAARGAQIISLHELFHGEYFCRTEDPELFNLSEAVPGPTTEKLAQIAKEKKVALVVSLFERRAPGIYHNTCAVLDADGSFLGKYRKMHIPDDPLYYEKFYFTPGDLGFPNFDTKYARIGVQICWDQWYPEGSRLTALGGAQVIFYPTSIGWHPHEKAQFGAAQLDAWWFEELDANRLRVARADADVKAAGVVLGLQQVPRDGGIILASSIERSQLDAILATDPFAQRQLAKYDVAEFKATRLAPGLSLPVPA